MFVDNHNLDVKEKVTEESVKILDNKNNHDDEQERETNKIILKHDVSRTTNEKRYDTVDSGEMGHLLQQFRVLCSNYVFLFVTM
jgi:hypothetical protein